MSSGRKCQGRKKIEMKRMTNESNMQVTFSKRRSGLFKKASELSTLCGADVAVIVFSPSEKVFSFGHPDFDTVINRYLSHLPSQNNGTMQLIEALRNANVCELNSQLTRLNGELDIEKTRRDQLSHMNKMDETHNWWASPIDGMDFNQLRLLKNAFEELKKRIPDHANRLVNQGSSTQTMPYFVGNGSFSNMHVHHQPNPEQGQMFLEQPFQNPMLQPFQNLNMYIHHQPNPQQGQMFSEQPFQANPQQGQMFQEQSFQDPVLQHNLFNFNNMGGGGGGYGPPRFF